jgi:hypothetical protein
LFSNEAKMQNSLPGFRSWSLHRSFSNWSGVNTVSEELISQAPAIAADFCGSAMLAVQPARGQPLTAIWGVVVPMGLETAGCKSDEASGCRCSQKRVRVRAAEHLSRELRWLRTAEMRAY